MRQWREGSLLPSLAPRSLAAAAAVLSAALLHCCALPCAAFGREAAYGQMAADAEPAVARNCGAADAACLQARCASLEWRGSEERRRCSGWSR